MIGFNFNHRPNIVVVTVGHEYRLIRTVVIRRFANRFMHGTYIAYKAGSHPVNDGQSIAAGFSPCFRGDHGFVIEERQIQGAALCAFKIVVRKVIAHAFQILALVVRVS